MNRREYLISLGIAVPGTVAGCIDMLDDQDNPTFYAPWIPESMGEVTLNVAASTVPTESHSHEGPGILGLDLETIDSTIRLGAWPEEGYDLDPDILSVNIVNGDFDTETAVDMLTAETAMTADGEYADFQVYENDRIVGVRDGVIIDAGTADDLEATIDANQQETNRLADTHDDFGLIVERLGSPEEVGIKFMRDHRVPSARGSGTTYENTERDLREVWVYEDEDLAADHQSEVEDQFSPEQYTDVEIEVDERCIIVEATVL